MTEPQPSRSVKRPRNFYRRLSAMGSAWPPSPPRLGSPKMREPVREVHQSLIRGPSLSHFFVVWPIFRLKWRNRSKVLGKTGFRGEIGLTRFPLTWNPVAGKESRKINRLARVILKKARHLLRHVGLGNAALWTAAGSEPGFLGVFRVVFAQRLAQFFHGPALDLADSFL